MGVLMLDPQRIHEAREAIAPYLAPSPLLYSEPLSRLCKRPVWLKLESLHLTGSFKVRPAFFGLLRNLAICRQRGVLTSSSGNFAQAVAYAAQRLDVSACIVMREDTSPFKLARTQQWGAEIVFCAPHHQARWETTHRLQEERGVPLLHPYDTAETIAANGTIALELLEQLDQDFDIWVPVSGGGLIGGISLALEAHGGSCRVYGVQPAVNASMARSLEAGYPLTVEHFTTRADALVAAMPGTLGFAITKRNAAVVSLVEEEALDLGVSFLAQEHKLIAEHGGAIAISALLQSSPMPTSRPLVIVVSGGNIAPTTLAKILQEIP